VTDAPRPGRQRKADVLAKLEESLADVWVASASAGANAAGAGAAGAEAAGAKAALVPLSLAWDGTRVIVATPATTVTARNILASREARLAVGPTRDVVMIDAALDDAIAASDAPPSLAERYAAQAGWDPRATGDSVYLTLRPVRIQAWREANEIAGRTIMRDGVWLF